MHLRRRGSMRVWRTRGQKAMSGGAVVLGVILLLGACGSSSPQPPASTPGTSTLPSSSTTSPGNGLGSYMPLYPFATADDVHAWQQAYAHSGTEPWHLDAGVTATSFTSYLGLSQVDTVVASRTDSSGEHVSVGFHVPSSSQTVTSAVVHLVRWGTGADAPWEAVGTDDTTFSLAT